MKTTCKKSWPMNLCRTSCGSSILLTTDVVPKISPNLNVIGHLPVPAGWGSCLLRLAIFVIAQYLINYADLGCHNSIRL